MKTSAKFFQIENVSGLTPNQVSMARDCFRVRPIDYLTNSASREAWYNVVVAVARDLGIFSDGRATNVTPAQYKNWFDIAGLPE